MVKCCTSVCVPLQTRLPPASSSMSCTLSVNESNATGVKFESD